MDGGTRIDRQDGAGSTSSASESKDRRSQSGAGGDEDDPSGLSSLPGLTAGQLDRVGEVVQRLWNAREGRFGPVLVPVLALRHRRPLAGLNEALDRLPTVRVHPSDTPAGRELERLLLGTRGRSAAARQSPSRRARLGAQLFLVPDRRCGVAVLAVPPEPATYLAGRKRQALRTNLRRAREQGVTVVEITDGPSQIRAVEAVLAVRDDGWLGQHRTSLVRAVDAGLVRLIAGYGPDGDILTVALVVCDRPWAVLRLCVSVEGRMASYARYATHAYMVDALSRSGITTLLVDSVLDVSPGLRYFQARLGFELMNVLVE